MWRNQDLVVYHGTYDGALGARVALSKCSPKTDFGQGFYTTTHRHQAEQWANEKVRSMAASAPGAVAAVYPFELDRNALAGLDWLVFPRSVPDFWAFVTHCRANSPVDHGRWKLSPPDPVYDVVVGPVTLWPQSLVIGDCDQISFHTQSGCNLLDAGKQPPTLPSSGQFFG